MNKEINANDFLQMKIYDNQIICAFCLSLKGVRLMIFLKKNSQVIEKIIKTATTLYY